jgi:prolyl-tRNA editing enzyme YbaK/EbsC (Cys-tRNA(Pro) deacylase)
MTMSELPASAKKVQDAADSLGLAITVRQMAESTRTAEEAAAACGVTVGQIVKSLVFTGAESGKPYLLLVSGTNRVNEKGAAAHLGEKLKRPDADAVRALTGYVIGGIPPLGHDVKLATFMDEDLLQYDVIWAAAGTPKAVFRTEPAKLRDAVSATVISVK